MAVAGNFSPIWRERLHTPATPKNLPKITLNKQPMKFYLNLHKI
jgi:hypothetical protein